MKLFQYLLEGLKSSSVKVAPERNSSIHIDIRFDLIDEYFEKKTNVFQQDFPILSSGVLFVFITKQASTRFI